MQPNMSNLRINSQSLLLGHKQQKSEIYLWFSYLRFSSDGHIIRIPQQKLWRQQALGSKFKKKKRVMNRACIFRVISCYAEILQAVHLHFYVSVVFGKYCTGDACVWQMSDAVDDGASEAESCSASCSGATGGSGSCVDSQLADAVRLKTEGNAFYREKNVRSAIGRYHRALLVLRGLDSEVTSSLKGFGPQSPILTPEKEELLRSTQIDCYNNLAGRC